jgi:hypothetical protein
MAWHGMVLHLILAQGNGKSGHWDGFNNHLQGTGLRLLFGI